MFGYPHHPASQAHAHLLSRGAAYVFNRSTAPGSLKSRSSLHRERVDVLDLVGIDITPRTVGFIL